MGRGFFEATNLGDVKEKFSSRAVVEHEEKFFLVLESVIHLYNEGMSNALQNTTLTPSLLHLLHLPHVVLLYHLHRIVPLLGVFLLD